MKPRPTHPVNEINKKIEGEREREKGNHTYTYKYNN
jgi:hypothetical protein